MNIETGQLIEDVKLSMLPLEEQKKYIRVERDLSKHELARKQIALYAPCGCGSGKKFKFCCKK